MDTKRSMKELEARLGFNFPTKLTSKNQARINETPELSKLLEGLTEINERYAHYGIPQIRESEGIKENSYRLFHRLGPTLWPDFDEVDGPFPVWLLNPTCHEYYDDSTLINYPKHLHYSNNLDREALAERFHSFVCSKILNYHKNHSRREPTDTGSFFDSEGHESPEAENISALRDNIEDEDDNISNYSASEPHRFLNRDSTPLSSDRKRMAAPVAPMMPNQHSKRNARAKLDAAASAHAHRKLAQHAEQQTRPVQDRPEQFGDIPATSGYHSPGPSVAVPQAVELHETPVWPPELNNRPKASMKRPAADNVHTSSTKWSRLSPTVYLPKPSLVVILKLTREKGTFKRAETAPVQQPQSPTPVQAEPDEIFTKMSARPANHRVDGADDDGRPQQGNHQSTMQYQDTVNTTNGTAKEATCSPNDFIQQSTTSRHDMTSVFLSLYLDEGVKLDHPDGCVILTELTTRSVLFEEMQDDLDDKLDQGDKITTVDIRRADGGVFPGPNVITMPIKQAGKQDMWQELVKILSVHGAGDGGLRGYVKVKKAIGVR